MQLAAYEYDIRYKPTTDHGNADLLLRLPLPLAAPSCNTIGSTTFNIGQLQSLPVTTREIQKDTRKATVGKVYRYVGGQIKLQMNLNHTEINRESWPLKVDAWGIQVVIMKALQPQVLNSLHTNHPGISRMKAIARSHFWWEGLDQEMETLGKSCQSCQSNQSNPSVAPFTSLGMARSTVGANPCGLYVHSKWPEVAVMTSTTSEKTIEALRSMFSRQCSRLLANINCT